MAMRHYVFQVLIAFDQLLCTLIGGWADESLSSYAYRLDRAGKLWGRICRPAIDWLFRVLRDEQNHCWHAYLAERDRAHLPPEFRVINK